MTLHRIHTSPSRTFVFELSFVELFVFTGHTILSYFFSLLILQHECRAHRRPYYSGTLLHTLQQRWYVSGMCGTENVSTISSAFCMLQIPMFDENENGGAGSSFRQTGIITFSLSATGNFAKLFKAEKFENYTAWDSARAAWKSELFLLRTLEVLCIVSIKALRPFWL